MIEVRDRRPGHVPKLEAPPGGSDQVLARGSPAELRPRPNCQRIIVLRIEEVGAVQRKERLASPHRLSDEVHEQLLDETIDFDVDLPHARFVDSDAADRAPVAGNRTLRGFRGPQPNELLALGVDLHPCQPRHLASGGNLVLVYRHIVHPHRALARDRRGIGRVHWRAVEDDPVLRFSRVGGFDRHEFHAADWAVARLVRRVVRVHRAVVERPLLRGALGIVMMQPWHEERACYAERHAEYDEGGSSLDLHGHPHIPFMARDGMAASAPLLWVPVDAALARAAVGLTPAIAAVAPPPAMEGTGSRLTSSCAIATSWASAIDPK